MKRFLAIISLLVGLFLFVNTGDAHKGHHGPSQSVPPNGGMLRDNKDLQLELVKLENEVRIYSHTLDLKKTIPPSEIKILKLSVKGTNRKAKDRKATHKIVEDYYQVTFKKDKSYKYDVTAEISYQKKKQKKVKWQIEP